MVSSAGVARVLARNVAAELVRDPLVPVTQAEQDNIQVAVQVASQPILEHLTNNEPWYQSRVTIGAIISIAVPLLGFVGVQMDVVDQEVATNAALAIGTAIGGFITLYGRWKAKKPLGT